MARKKSEAQIEKEELFKSVAAVVDEREISEYVGDNYLPFSWSVCLDRALVFSTDGLKPVQRRIIYTAYRTGLTDKSNKVKSSTFEGKVAAYSPHGGCYGSIVNLAKSEDDAGQPRDIRVPLICGKGNWGSLDAGAAAPRYTEMNLYPAAMELISELNEDAVDMVPNYNNTDVEPKFLPARWPVAIINGVPDAMAVGFACNLPSHNPDEIMDATIALLRNPELTNKDLEKIIKGPDFDCGCDIIACIDQAGKPVDGVKSYLETGKGSFIMKAKYEVIEDNGHYVINFIALPYKVGPEKVIESIKKKYDKGDFKELASWKDLSDFNNPVNLEITTKKGVNISKVLSELFRFTPLQTTYAANNTIVSNNIPQKMDICSILGDFIEFRKMCTVRKLNYRLKNLDHKLHLQEAIQAVLVDIDKCIEIIRKSNTAEDACKKLMKQFSIDEEQANYILSLQLRKLTKSDSQEIKQNIKDLRAKLKEINDILSKEKNLIEFIAGEMEETKKKISSPRKCKVYKKEQKNEDVEDKEVFLGFNEDGKVFRTFDKSDEVYKVSSDAKVAVINKNKAELKSIYELPDNKPVVMSRFGTTRPLTVCANEGYLLLVGAMGALKLVDLNGIKYPNRPEIDRILSQEVIEAHVIKSIEKGKIAIAGDKHEKVVELKDIPVQSLTAGGKKFLNEEIDFVELML